MYQGNGIGISSSKDVNINSKFYQNIKISVNEVVAYAMLIHWYSLD